MPIAIDLRSLMETGGEITGVENYLLNILGNFSIEESKKYFGFYNRYNPVNFPMLRNDLVLKKTNIPNKVFNTALTLLGEPKFEKLYGDFETLWMPDLRPFAIKESTKLAITVHDLSPIMHPELYSLKRRLWHKVVRYKKSFQRANVIFAVSEYTKYDLVKIFGVDPQKIKVIHSGIDHIRFRTDLDPQIKKEVQKKYSLPDKFILSISTVEPRKNIESLVSAFERIKNPDVSLVIAGRLGWLYSDLIIKIKNSPKKNQIILTSYIDEEDKPYLISLSEIVCYPSYYEGFGFVPLEAMACGVPVISSARTSMPEICKDAAILVEPSSLADLIIAIDALLSDKNLREKFIQKGLERVKSFEWKKTVQEIHNHLMEL
jgi:glycosyltransferase involved in cell wall biosynthesis